MGRISTAKVKSEIDWIVYHSKDIPGPSQYNISGMAREGARAVKFSDAVPLSDLDLTMLRASETPGPDAYSKTKSSLSLSGGRISTAKPKSDVEWKIYNAKSIPGPQDYAAPELPKSGGGKFNESKVPTTIDVIQLRAKQIPGPGQYKNCAPDKVPAEADLTFILRPRLLTSSSTRPKRYLVLGSTRP